MRVMLFLLSLAACDDGTPMQNPPSADLSMPKIVADLSGSGTTCNQAITCMQGCTGDFTSCSGGCADQLSSIAQPRWDSFVACLQVHCGPADGSTPICDNFADTSCIICANTYCVSEITDCSNH